MVARSATLPPRLLRATRSLPAASRLRPAVLLSLQAFDAAVRLNSFKAAAEALHLTPSAVSHRIRNLERTIGGPLFASAWLIPRLPGFMADHPAIELVIESSLQILDFDNDAVHAGVRVGDGNWPGLFAQHLMDLHATPIAAPELVRRLRLERPADVARASMIHVTSFPLAWPEWLRQVGAGPAKPKQTIWVDSFEAAVQLTEQGAGVALGLLPLFAEREAADRLCQPMAQRCSTGAYWLVHRPEEQGNKALRAFKRWLAAELGDG